MKNLNGKIEIAANILIVIVAVLLIGIIAQRYLSTPDSSAKVQPTIGKKVDVSNFDFSRQSKTVVLALQTTCHFCNESAPFYKRLIEETKGKDIKFVAVFPTKIEESEKHLQDLGITGFEVKQAPITSLDTSGTPTLILTNSKGEVEKFWVGKLPAEKESEIINLLKS